MESFSAVLKVLRELLKINRDRVVGYNKASQDTNDPGLKALFLTMADQSLKNITDILKEIINHNGSTQLDEPLRTYKIHGVWANFKSKFSGNSIKSVLTSCELREAAALHFYQKAKDKAFSTQVTDLIERHVLSLKSSHEVIRVYRQAYTNVGKLHS